MSSDLSFTYRDEFKRKKIADNIIKLLTPDTDLSPLVIDGEWGTGKTEFSLKLKNLISTQSSETNVIYIDAFKGDHSDSPLLLIISAIVKALPEGPKRIEFLKYAIPALRLTLKTTGKAGLSWLLRQDIDQIGDDFKDAIRTIGDSSIDNTVGSLLKDYIEEEKNIESLKKILGQISKDNKTVIIIDELDRCKPSFSTSMLETIKHVFDINNVFFILVTNMNQLKASINHIYGSNIDAKKYLDKFIKYKVSLPSVYKKTGMNRESISVKHIENILTNEPLKFESYDLENIKLIISNAKLTLRDVEKFAKGLSVFQLISARKIDSTMGENEKICCFLAVFINCFDNSDNLMMKLQDNAHEHLKSLLNLDFATINYGDNPVREVLSLLEKINHDSKINDESIQLLKCLIEKINTMLFIH